MFRSILCAAVLVPAAFGAVSAQAQTQDRDQTHITVSVNKVDFNDAAQVGRLYKHLRSVAGDACDNGVYLDSARNPDYQTCVDDAVSSAVHELNRTQLSQLHDGDHRGGDMAMTARKDDRDHRNN